MTKQFEINKYAEKHLGCACVIRYKHVEGIAPTPALICKPHNIFIKWLSKREAQTIVDSNLLEIEPWIKTNKNAKVKIQRSKRTTGTTA